MTRKIYQRVFDKYVNNLAVFISKFLKMYYPEIAKVFYNSEEQFRDIIKTSLSGSGRRNTQDETRIISEWLVGFCLGVNITNNWKKEEQKFRKIVQELRINNKIKGPRSAYDFFYRDMACCFDSDEITTSRISVEWKKLKEKNPEQYEVYKKMAEIDAIKRKLIK